jgi:hypothetical protein
MGNFGSCVSGIITGLLLTAAGLWGSVGGGRGVQNFDNLTLSMDQYDPTSSHPAHRFIGHYHGLLSQNASMASNVGYVSYAQTGDIRHRLVISPRSTGIGRRQDDSVNNGASVSYEWT